MRTGQKTKAFYMKHISTAKGTMTVFNVGESKKTSDGKYENMGFINCIVYSEIPIQDWVIIGEIHEVKLNQYYNKQGQKVTQTQVVVDLIEEENVMDQYAEASESDIKIENEDLPF